VDTWTGKRSLHLRAKQVIKSSFALNSTEGLICSWNAGDMSSGIPFPRPMAAISLSASELLKTMFGCSRTSDPMAFKLVLSPSGTCEGVDSKAEFDAGNP
jgi:hypothetical protein